MLPPSERLACKQSAGIALYYIVSGKVVVPAAAVVVASGVATACALLSSQDETKARMSRVSSSTP